MFTSRAAGTACGMRDEHGNEETGRHARLAAGKTLSYLGLPTPKIGHGSIVCEARD